MLAPQFAGLPEDTTEENLQSAHPRHDPDGALSIKTGAIVLTTGNKSEMATATPRLRRHGRRFSRSSATSTDLSRRQAVRWRNAQPGGPCDPRQHPHPPAFGRARPDQCDQDFCRPTMLDAIIAAYMRTRDLSPREIVAQGYPEVDVPRQAMLRRNEYKRCQSPPGARVTQRLRQGLGAVRSRRGYRDA